MHRVSPNLPRHPVADPSLERVAGLFREQVPGDGSGALPSRGSGPRCAPMRSIRAGFPHAWEEVVLRTISEKAALPRWLSPLRAGQLRRAHWAVPLPYGGAAADENTRHACLQDQLLDICQGLSGVSPNLTEVNPERPSRTQRFGADGVTHMTVRPIPPHAHARTRVRGNWKPCLIRLVVSRRRAQNSHRFGISRPTARRPSYSLSVIAWQLNGRRVHRRRGRPCRARSG